MRAPRAAGLLATAVLLPALVGCASLRTAEAGSAVPVQATAEPTGEVVAPPAPEPTSDPAPDPDVTAAEPESPIPADATADELFEQIAATITVDGTDFHQIRYTPAAYGQPADVMYGTDQWEAHVADNRQPIGPIIVVRVTRQPATAVLKEAGAAPRAARLAASDPLTPVEPDVESPSGQELRLVVVPPPSGDGAVQFAATGVSDADVRAFVEAVTR